MKKPRTATSKTTGRANERENTGFGKIKARCGQKSSLHRHRREDQAGQLSRREGEQRGLARARSRCRLRESWLICRWATKPAVGQQGQIHDLMTEEVRGGCRKVLETTGIRKKGEGDRGRRTVMCKVSGRDTITGTGGRQAGGLSGDRQAVPF